MKKRSITNIICIVIFLVILFGIVMMFMNALNPKLPEVDSWYKYKIKSGDTLWSITPDNDGYDMRVLIKVVKDYNNLTSSNIEEGDVIELPIWK